MENNNNQTSFYQFSDQLGVQTNNFPNLSLNDSIWSTSYGSKKPETRRNFDIQVGGGLNSNSTDSVSQTSDNNPKTNFNGFNHSWKIESPQIGSQFGSNSNGPFNKGVYWKPSYNFNSVNGVNANVVGNMKGSFNGKFIDQEVGNFNHHQQQFNGKSVKENKNRYSNNNDESGSKNGVEKIFKTLPPAESLPRNETVGGYIFVCNNDTMQENLKRQLFGYNNMNMQATYSLTKNYRVPIELRAIKQEAYTPRMFPIGPLHQDKSELKNMQKEKRRYMSHFFDRLVESNKGKFQIIGESSENSNHILARNKCIRVVMELEEEARACYAEDINLDKHQFAEMLLLDACFILELFYRCKLISIQNHNDESYPIDSLADNVPMVQILRNDLMLLENQIPYFVLQKLFDLVPGSKKVSIGIPDMSLGEHIFCFFNSVPMLQHKCLNFKDGTYRHLLDMLSHVCSITPSMIPSNYSHHNWGITRCATELLKSGIQIRCDHSKVVMDIKFNNGEISIPQVIIDESSDTLLRNLIALEQTSTGRHLVTSYVKIMSTLIRSPKDAYLLEQLGIISKSDVGMDASAFFKSLCKGVVFVDFCFTDLCREVNDFQIPVWRGRRLKGYFGIKYVEWKESIEDLRREYFQNRWRSMNFLAASSVIVFAFLQTFYAIRSNYHPPSH